MEQTPTTPTTPASKPFAFGTRSIGFMADMHPGLIAVFELAISISTVDFGFSEKQVRTIVRQQELVKLGASQTMKSNHIEHLDRTGETKELYGHAGDAVPWIGGRFVWDWDKIYHVAAAVAEAGRQLNVLDKLCWGGVWDQWMSQYAGKGPKKGQAMAEYLNSQAAVMRQAEATYCVRHPGKDFVDGPHYQYFVKG